MGWTKRSAAVSVLLAMEEHQREAGRRALAIRERLLLSQEDVAQKTGLSVKTISRYENGRHEGRRDTSRRIAEALGVPVEELVGEPPAPLGLGQETQLDRIEAMLNEILDRMEHNQLSLPTPEDVVAAAGGGQRPGGKRSQEPAAGPRTRRSRRAA